MTTNSQRKIILTPIFKPFLLTEENSNHEKDSSYLRPHFRGDHGGDDVRNDVIHQEHWFRQGRNCGLYGHGARLPACVLRHSLLSRECWWWYDQFWSRVCRRRSDHVDFDRLLCDCVGDYLFLFRVRFHRYV